MTIFRRATVVAVLAAGAMLLTACGSGSGDDAAHDTDIFPGPGSGTSSTVTPTTSSVVTVPTQASLTTGTSTASPTTSSSTSSPTTSTGPTSDVVSIPPPPPTTTSHSATTAPATSSQSHAGPSAQQTFDDMSLGERVGQLLMAGTEADTASKAVLDVIDTYHVGSVILTGRSHAGVAATKKVTTTLQHAAPGTKLLIAADQEGGNVQVLQGPGFSDMPTALSEGTKQSLAQIRSHARTWGTQLSQAGVNFNMAPVMDTVSQKFAPDNAPIGYWHREYGYTAHDVAMRATAFANGMRDAGIATSIKHFPGLGRVTGNTDTTAGVTDSVTTRHSDSVDAFGVGINAGAKIVMMSTAIYSKIDPGTPAAFSSTIIDGMLRGDLGFQGVVISDSLEGAQQIVKWSPAERALNLIGAGGDLVLTTSTDLIKPMYHALVTKAQSDSGFRQKVDDAALRVLTLKQQMGLLGG